MAKKRVLITGAKGMLGSKLCSVLSGTCDCIGVDIDDFDITDEQSVVRGVTAARPDIVLHCAAYTAVDKAEDDAERCSLINEKGTTHIAQAAREAGAVMLYYSTDYVFDGKKDSPYVEADTPNPVSVYGRSKHAGEEAVKRICERYFIVRIAWLFGENGKNIIQTILRLGKEKPSISFVNDQFGSPTYTADVALQTMQLLERTEWGVYHCTAEGICTWYDVAGRTLAAAGIQTPVSPIATSAYPTRALRPAYSYLENANLKRLGINVMPAWESGIDRYVHGLSNGMGNG
ncbi:MAG: dTDP-4-dehydrorhamnose reductase [Spirochaetota bacterium]